ncbi:MAG TPA: hypothetical protein VM848_07705 [Acidimicrobiia bacterium]|nr:hypothetical protein [Acidimicrobiia bacterium]
MPIQWAIHQADSDRWYSSDCTSPQLVWLTAGTNQLAVTASQTGSHNYQITLTPTRHNQTRRSPMLIRRRFSRSWS